MQWLQRIALGRDGRYDRRPGARTIRIPVHMMKLNQQVVRTNRLIINEIGREPTRKLGMA
jgi:hypothetical protein